MASSRPVAPPPPGSSPDPVNPRNPYPTVDVVIEVAGGIVLVLRRNPPPGWALPGGFVEYGESLERAAVREAREETGLDVELTRLLGVYSSPGRDPRFHTVATVFVGRASGAPTGGDDAREARVFDPRGLPSPMAFDHAGIVADYLEMQRTGKPPFRGGRT